MWPTRTAQLVRRFTATSADSSAAPQATAAAATLRTATTGTISGGVSWPRPTALANKTRRPPDTQQQPQHAQQHAQQPQHAQQQQQQQTQLQQHPRSAEAQLSRLSPYTMSRLSAAARSAHTLGDEALLLAVTRDKLLCLFLQPAELLRVIKLAAPFEDVVGDHTIPWISTLYRFIGRSMTNADWSRAENTEALSSLAAWLAEDRSPHRKKAVLHALTWVLPPVISKALAARELSPPQVSRLAWAYGRGLVSPRVAVWPSLVSYTQANMADMSTGDLARVLWAVAEGHYIGAPSSTAPAAASVRGGYMSSLQRQQLRQLTASPLRQQQQQQQAPQSSATAAVTAPTTAAAAAAAPSSHLSLVSPASAATATPASSGDAGVETVASPPSARDLLFSSAAAHLAATLDARDPTAISLATLAAAFSIGCLPAPGLMAAVGGHTTALMMAHLSLSPKFRGLVMSVAGEAPPAAADGPGAAAGAGGESAPDAGWWMRDFHDFGRMRGRRDRVRAPSEEEQADGRSNSSSSGVTAAAAVASARQSQLASLGRVADASTGWHNSPSLSSGSSSSSKEATSAHASLASSISSSLASLLTGSGNDAAPYLDAASAQHSNGDNGNGASSNGDSGYGGDSGGTVDADGVSTTRIPTVEASDARAFITIAWSLLQQRSWDGAFFAVFRRLYPRMATQATRRLRDVSRLVAVHLGVSLLSPFPHLALGSFEIDEATVRAEGGAWTGRRGRPQLQLEAHEHLQPAGAAISSSANAAAAAAASASSASPASSSSSSHSHAYSSALSDDDDDDGGDADGDDDDTLSLGYSSRSSRGGDDSRGEGMMLLVPEGPPPPSSPYRLARKQPLSGLALLSPTPALLRAGVPMLDPLGRQVRGELTAISHAAAALAAGIERALPDLKRRMRDTASSSSSLHAIPAAVAALRQPSSVASHVEVGPPPSEGAASTAAPPVLPPPPAPPSCDVYGPYVSSCGLVFDFAFPALRAAVLVVTPKFMAPTRDAVAMQMLTHAALAQAAGWDVHLVPSTELPRRHRHGTSSSSSSGGRGVSASFEVEEATRDGVAARVLRDIHDGYWASRRRGDEGVSAEGSSSTTSTSGTAASGRLGGDAGT